MAFKDLIPYVRKKCHDFRQLGRVASWLVYANPKHQTRVVVAYGVGRSKPKGLRTRYQQELRYLQRRNWHLKTNPRKMFEDDLIQMLKMWKSQGDRLLLGLDMNDNILKGRLAKRLFKKVGM